MVDREDRRYAFVNRDPLSETLAQERKLRKSKALWQCECKISMPFLPPVGQQLRYLNGHKRTVGIQLLPLDLMSPEQTVTYTKVQGVRCWWDGHLFDGNPVGCPIRIKPYREKLDRPIHHTRDTWTFERHDKPQKFRRLKYNGKLDDKGRLDRRLSGYIPIHMREDYSKPALHNCSKTKRVYKQTHQTKQGFVLHGYFCSWACARAYGQNFIPRLRFVIGSWIYKILLEISKQWKADGMVPEDYHVRPIAAAPHFSLLESYGGSMNIEDFRRINEQDNRTQLTVVPQWAHIIPSGMLATEMPINGEPFSLRYNQQMEQLCKYYKNKQVTKLSNVTQYKTKRTRRNAILDCMK